jgi:hypothetical protein
MVNIELYQVRLKFKSTECTVINIPDGLDEFDFRFIRSKRYHSVFNKFSFPLGFILDGQEFVENAYIEDGPDAEVEIWVDIQNPESLAYEDFIYGVLDFHQRKWTIESTELPILDSSKQTKFIERDDIAYDVRSLISTDGITIPELANVPQLCRYTAISPVAWANLEINNPVTLNVVDEGTLATHIYSHTGTIPFNNINNSIKASPDTSGAPEPIYINESSETKEVSVKFEMLTNLNVSTNLTTTPDPIVDVIWFFIIETGGGNNVADNFIFIGDTSQPDGSYNNTISFNNTYSIPSGGTIKAYGSVKSDNSSVFDTYSFSVQNIITDYSIEEKGVTVDVSDNYSVLAFEAMARLIQLSTSELDTSKILSSTILGRKDSALGTLKNDGRLSMLAFTNGFHLSKGKFIDNSSGIPKTINRLSKEPIVLKTKDAFKCLDAIGNLGLWYNPESDIFEIKDKREYFKDKKILTLEGVEKLEITVANDLYINNVKGGFDTDNDYDNTNGRLEFNGKITASTPASARNTLDIESPITGDTIGITEARKKQFIIAEGAQDSKSDTKLFVTQMKRISGLVSQDDPLFIAETGFDFHKVTGLIDGEQYYNYRITPKRNLLTNSNRISPSFWKKTNSKLIVNSSRNNVPVTTQLTPTSPIVAELKNEDVNSTTVRGIVDLPLWTNEYITCTAPLSDNDVRLLMKDPHGYIEAPYLGKIYEGFVEEVSTNNFKERANIKLRRRPDPSNLLDIYDQVSDGSGSESSEDTNL